MKKIGKTTFWIGISIAIIMGIIVSLDPGYFCNLDKSNLPQSIWSYSALCFTFWGFSVPIGLIIAATGILIISSTNKKTVLKFGFGALGVYIFISFANGPMPHVPFLFGIGGTVLLIIYFLILWKNAKKFKDNIYKLAGYTSLLIGFWFTCGLGSRQYQSMLGSGESPIDIMIYFVLAMVFFMLSERRTNK